MIIDRYRIGDILKVKIGSLSVCKVKVTRFVKTIKGIGLDVTTIPEGNKQPPFTSAILDDDIQVLEFIEHGDIPYDQSYEKRYKELVDALKVIQKHLS